MWSGMSFALISHFWPKKSRRIDQSEDRRHPRLSREVNHKNGRNQIQFYFLRRQEDFFFKSADFHIAIHFQFTGLSDKEGKMKGNKAQIKKDIERFNQQYSVGAVITNSANGVIYHAKRKSDGFTCVVKVRILTICTR